MTSAEPNEVAPEGRLGWMRRFFNWTTNTAIRRMITLWLVWTALAWTVFMSALFLELWSGTIVLTGPVLHSTVYALVAAAAFIRPCSVGSLLSAVIPYLAAFGLAALYGLFQIVLWGGSASFFAYQIGTILVSYLGPWIWIGVSLYLASQFVGICVTRQCGEVREVFTLKKMVAATMLAAVALALPQSAIERQIWMAPDMARLISMLAATLAVIPWCAVLWMQVSSRRTAWLILGVTTVVGMGLNELLFATAWSSLEFKQANATIHRSSLVESALSWLMSMLGIWIALRIARVGGYRVVRTTAAPGTDNESSDWQLESQ